MTKNQSSSFFHLFSGASSDKISLKFWGLTVSAVCLMSSGPLFAQSFTLNDLTAEEQDQLTLGGQVRRTQPNPDPNSSFDELTVFQVVSSTPAEAAAVFTQYNRHKEYFKNMIVSQSVSSSDHFRDTINNYTIQINVFGLSLTESYTVDDTLSLESDVPGGFQVNWKMIKPGANTVHADGSARFEPYGSDSTLIVYDNSVTPYATFFTRPFINTSIAKNYAAQTLVDIVSSLKVAIENEKQFNHDDLQEKVKSLQTNLSFR